MSMLGLVTMFRMSQWRATASSKTAGYSYLPKSGFWLPTDVYNNSLAMFRQGRLVSEVWTYVESRELYVPGNAMREILEITHEGKEDEGE